MARELSIHVWCDPCQEEGERREAAHQGLPVSIGGSPLRELDLCARHHAQLVGPLLRLLDRRGHDPARGEPEPPGTARSRKSRQAGPFRCLVPGCVASPLKHRGSLWQHLRKLHGMDLEEYQATYGKLVPLSDEELAELVVEVACELCGQLYSTELGHRFPRQALVSHMWGHHAVKWEG